MSTTIASLGVSLFARTGKFSKGMGRAKNNVRNFSKETRNLSRRLTGLSAALSTVVAGAGVGSLIKQQFSAVDASAKMADTLGISTQRMAGLQHQAKLAGIDQGILNSSMLSFVKRLGEARNGMGPLYQSLSKTNPELLRQLITAKSTGEAMDLLANNASALSRETDLAELSSKAFNKSGIVMGRILMGGAEGMRAAQAEAENLNATLNRTDAAKIEMANDSVARMQTKFQGLAQQAAVALAPVMQGVADKISNIGINSETVRGKTLAFLKGASVGAAALVHIFDSLRLAWDGFKTGVLGSVTVILTVVDTVITSFKGLYNMLKTMSNKIMGFVMNPIDTVKQGVKYWTEGWNFKDAFKGSDLIQSLRDSFAVATRDSAMNVGKSFAEYISLNEFSSVAKFFEDLEKSSTTQAEGIAKTIEEGRKLGQLTLANQGVVDEIGSGLKTNLSLAQRIEHLRSGIQEYKDSKNSSEQNQAPTFARAINLDRVAIGGNSNRNTKQVVTSPQFDTMIELFTRLLEVSRARNNKVVAAYAG